MRIFQSILFVALGFCQHAHAGLTWQSPVQEFHRAPSDLQIEASFKFKNEGATPVTITRLQSSCGCTTANLEKKTYAAGETGEVKVKFVFGARVGSQRKMLTVSTSDGELYTLELHALIEESVIVTPALVFWRIGEPSTSKTVRVRPANGTIVKIQKISSSNPRLTGVLESTTPGDPFLISITPADTVQREAGEILITTDYPIDSPKTYKVYVRIK